MRNKILSLAIAGLIMAGFILITHLLRDETSGQAMASAGIHTGNNIDDGRGLGNKRDIRRKVSYNPDTLLELNAQHVRSLLDEPGLVRSEAPTTIWQYRTSSCVLDLYFSGQAKDASKPVVHYEMRAREKGVDDADVQESCVKDILRSRNGFQMVGVGCFYKSLSE